MYYRATPTPTTRARQPTVSQDKGQVGGVFPSVSSARSLRRIATKVTSGQRHTPSLARSPVLRLCAGIASLARERLQARPYLLLPCGSLSSTAANPLQQMTCAATPIQALSKHHPPLRLRAFFDHDTGWPTRHEADPTAARAW